MGQLDQLVKKEFVLLYTQNNFLDKFHERVLQSIRDNNYIIKENSDKKESFYTCVLSSCALSSCIGRENISRT